MNFKQKMINFISNLLYPKHIKCICCKSELPKQNVYDMCDKCYASAPLILNHFCPRCGMQLPKDGEGACINCKRNNYHFETARAVFSYKDKVVPMIHKFKYSKYKFLAEPFAYFMYDIIIKNNWKIDKIAYVPLHPKREKNRGYNQSRELAIHLSRLTNIPIFDDIVRIKDTPTQTKLSRKDREENVKNCFKVSSKNEIKNLNILLLDDVFTTGSTTNEICKELKHSGSGQIFVLTIAHGGFEQKI